MAIAGWRQFTALYFYTAVALFLGFLYARAHLSTWHILVLFACGVLSWGLIEYGLHRFIFHYHARSRLGSKLLYQVHLSHHDDPEAISKLFASLFLSVPIASIYWFLAWVATGSFAAAS